MTKNSFPFLLLSFRKILPDVDLWTYILIFTYRFKQNFDWSGNFEERFMYKWLGYYIIVPCKSWLLSNNYLRVLYSECMISDYYVWSGNWYTSLDHINACTFFFYLFVFLCSHNLWNHKDLISNSRMSALTWTRAEEALLSIQVSSSENFKKRLGIFKQVIFSVLSSSAIRGDIQIHISS